LMQTEICFVSINLYTLAVETITSSAKIVELLGDKNLGQGKMDKSIEQNLQGNSDLS
jgi:hypothetical protein